MADENMEEVPAEEVEMEEEEEPELTVLEALKEVSGFCLKW